MFFRRSVVRLVVLASATAVGLSCGEQSPVAVDPQTLSASTVSVTDTGLVSCSQTYDSATRVIGPKGGMIVVGPHILWVDSLALNDTVSITAVAPTDTLRWVRFQPEGLVFKPTVDGWSALLYTNYRDCGVPTSDTLRIAQVSDSLQILGYLQTYRKVRKTGSKGTQYVIGLLEHFSNYAIAW
jgi:hypothetical protein